MEDLSSEFKKKRESFGYVVIFTTILSLISALILALMASVLATPIEEAKSLDQSKQMLIAAKIFTHEDYFLVQNEKGEYVPAIFSKDAVLIASDTKKSPSRAELLEVYKKRLVPFFVNSKGEIKTAEELHINLPEYLSQHKKTGYYKQEWKIFYQIMPNIAKDNKEPIGYILPVNGFGLWDAIYGYIALEKNADTIIGISWYDQKETPGLGANIADAPWQNLFPGKLIFQENADGSTNFAAAPLGITVVKGKVSEVYGNSPKGKSAVDGMAGATLTGNGVTQAYKENLAAYRPLLIELHKKSEEKKSEEKKPETPLKEEKNGS